MAPAGRERETHQHFYKCPLCHHGSFILTKTLLFSTHCRSGKLHLTRIVVLQSRQKRLPGWDQPGNPFPLSPNQDEKRDGVHERLCIRVWSLCCHLLLPAWKKGIVWVWRVGWFSNPAAIHSQACCQHKLLCHTHHSFSSLDWTVQCLWPYWSNSEFY